MELASAIRKSQFCDNGDWIDVLGQNKAELLSNNFEDCLDYDILEKMKKEIEERMYLLRLKYERINIMQRELLNRKDYKQSIETDEEKVLRRKYEKRIIRKNDK